MHYFEALYHLASAKGRDYAHLDTWCTEKCASAQPFNTEAQQNTFQTLMHLNMQWNNLHFLSRSATHTTDTHYIALLTFLVALFLYQIYTTVPVFCHYLSVSDAPTPLGCGR